jgi:hypothetical protein
MKYCIMGFMLGMSCWLATSNCQAQDSMERRLLQQAPKLIKYFKDHGYKNVGVLKFLAAHEGQKLKDNLGTLNQLSARRLELALMLNNDPINPVGIVDKASDVASNISGASHLSAEGRQKLFTAMYPLAWGKEKVHPDAFVTGTIYISKDLRTLTFSLYCFDSAANKLVPLEDDFQVANSTDRLSEMGESFALRGLFDGGTVEVAKGKPQEKAYQEQVYQKAVAVREKKVVHPAHPASSYKPVTLAVYYNNKLVPYEFREGKAFIAEPYDGQTVHFGLSRDNSAERYGVVLKVNGENTLDKQRLPDLSCRKWILPTGEGPWTIRGYQIGNNKRETFRVASMAESRAREVYYGRDVGTITLTVFREQTRKPKPMILDDMGQYEIVVKKMTELPTRPKNYNALKAQFLDEVNDPRGLFMPGKLEGSKVDVVSFVADPNPIMCSTIVYYRKR